MSTRLAAKLAAALIAAFTIAGCVESHEPLITNAEPVLGERFEVHLYESFAENKATDFHTASYQWQDGQYVRASALSRDAKRFAAQALEGNDFIIQSTDERAKSYFYWIGRRLTPGVYQIFPLEEDDASETVRKAACASGGPEGVCHVRRYEQLLALAKATAAKPVRDAAVAVVLTR